MLYRWTWSYILDLHRSRLSTISPVKSHFKDLKLINPIFDEQCIPSNITIAGSDITIAGIGTLVITYRDMEDIELPNCFFVPSACIPFLCPEHWAHVTDTKIMWFFSHKPTISRNEPQEESKEGGREPPLGFLERLHRHQASLND